MTYGYYVVYYTNIPIYFCLRFLNIPRYVITSSLKKFLPFLFNFYMTKQGVIHLGSQNLQDYISNGCVCTIGVVKVEILRRCDDQSKNSQHYTH